MATKYSMMMLSMSPVICWQGWPRPWPCCPPTLHCSRVDWICSSDSILHELTSHWLSCYVLMTWAVLLYDICLCVCVSRHSWADWAISFKFRRTKQCAVRRRELADSADWPRDVYCMSFCSRSTNSCTSCANIVLGFKCQNNTTMFLATFHTAFKSTLYLKISNLQQLARHKM